MKSSYNARHGHPRSKFAAGADAAKERHDRAVQRNALWASLTPQQQLDSLNERFPDGAVRQKARIAARIK